MFSLENEDDIPTKNLCQYQETIAAAISCGLSNRMTAKLINALFVDLKLDLYVSVEKIRGLKEKYLKSLNEKHQNETKGLVAVGCDGKNGMVKLENCQSTSKDKQSMINSVTGNYLDHGLPGGSGEEICNFIYNVLEKYNSLSSILLLNLDGCKVNTGCHSGVVRYLEAKLEKPLSWIICCLHLNELVFTHLFEAIGEFSFLIFLCPLAIHY